MPRKHPPKTGAAQVYALKITLLGSQPTIWRRVHMLGNTKLRDLHYVIQIAMGWQNCHMHLFEVGGRRYGTMYPDVVEEGYPLGDEKRVLLEALLKAPKQKLHYEYDLGDGWQHEILLEKILPPDPAEKYPVCTGGANACPPEDCGGIGGYYHVLAAVADPKHPEHETYVEWMPPDFDAAAFSIEDVNAGLDHIAAWRKMAEGG